jgi:hypothetical protein
MTAESKGFAVESADRGPSKGATATATAVTNFDFSQLASELHSPVDSSLRVSASSMEFGGWRASGLVDQMPELGGHSPKQLFGDAGTQAANGLSSLLNLVDGAFHDGGGILGSGTAGNTGDSKPTPTPTNNSNTG